MHTHTHNHILYICTYIYTTKIIRGDSMGDRCVAFCDLAPCKASFRPRVEAQESYMRTWGVLVRSPHFPTLLDCFLLLEQLTKTAGGASPVGSRGGLFALPNHPSP